MRNGKWKYRHGRRYGHWSGVTTKENPKEKQLFNLADDPGETNNLIEKYPELAERLTTLLSQSPNQTMVLFEPASPSGTRYELEAGEVSGGANAGSRHVGNMQIQDAAVAISVDGGPDGGDFELMLGYASGGGANCSLLVNGVEQSSSSS